MRGSAQVQWDLPQKKYTSSNGECLPVDPQYLQSSDNHRRAQSNLCHFLKKNIAGVGHVVFAPYERMFAEVRDHQFGCEDVSNNETYKEPFPWYCVVPCQYDRVLTGNPQLYNNFLASVEATTEEYLLTMSGTLTDPIDLFEHVLDVLGFLL